MVQTVARIPRSRRPVCSFGLHCNSLLLRIHLMSLLKKITIQKYARLFYQRDVNYPVKQITISYYLMNRCLFNVHCVMLIELH